MRPVIFAQLAIINYLGGINKNDEKDPETLPGADDGRLERKSKRCCMIGCSHLTMQILRQATDMISALGVARLSKQRAEQSSTASAG